MVSKGLLNEEIKMYGIQQKVIGRKFISSAYTNSSEYLFPEIQITRVFDERLTFADVAMNLWATVRHQKLVKRIRCAVDLWRDGEEDSEKKVSTIGNFSIFIHEDY